MSSEREDQSVSKHDLNSPLYSGNDLLAEPIVVPTYMYNMNKSKIATIVLKKNSSITQN